MVSPAVAFAYAAGLMAIALVLLLRGTLHRT
jgi:hypothetical protein